MNDQISEDRCQFLTAGGKRCRAPRMDSHPALCLPHARQQQTREQENNVADPALAADLLGPVHDFRTAASINHVLGKLLLLLTTERISPRNAAVSAYICQLLLQSISEVKSELYHVRQTHTQNAPEFNKALEQIIKARQFPLVPPAHSAKSEALDNLPKSDSTGPILAGVSHASS